MHPRILALLVILPVLGMAADSPPLFPVAAPQAFPDAARAFEQTRQLILENYYSDTIDEESLWWAATHGMLRQISPPKDPERAALWPPEVYQRVTESLRGVTHASGIKSSFNAADSSLTVTAVEPGSPASGLLQPWDRILRIDDKPLVGLAAADIEAMLRGEDGTRVKLAVVRGLQVMQVEFGLREFRTPSVEVQSLPGEVLYVRIVSLSLGTAASLEEALRAASAARPGPLRVVLDLRDNGGGVFVEGLRVAELFLASNDILVRSVRRREGLQNYISSNPSPLAARLSVLVNANTASSAELVAAALRAHGIASLVGTPTFGKASMEETFTLDNGYRVKFMVGALYDPNGHSWQGTGLQPDILTGASNPLATATEAGERLRQDAALAAAVHLLQR